MQKTIINWNTFIANTKDLAKKLEHAHQINPFHGVVSVARGGNIPATIIAHQLDIREMYSVGARSYDNKSQSELEVYNEFKTDKRMLVVDDLLDTGSTFEALNDSFPNCVWCAVYVKPKAIGIVNDMGVIVARNLHDDWIVLPWEK